jgi:hypothetical protein
LKPDKIYEPMPPDWNGAWDTAEKYMRDGFLPPYWLCRLLPVEHLEKFTRRRQWVLSGTIGTLKRVEGDTSILMKSLRNLNRQYRGA